MSFHEWHFPRLARWEFGCNLLHNHPEVFSGGAFREGGPTQKELNDTRFTTYSIAYGSHADEFVEAKCTGAEPGMSILAYFLVFMHIISLIRISINIFIF